MCECIYSHSRERKDETFYNCYSFLEITVFHCFCLRYLPIHNRNVLIAWGRVFFTLRVNLIVLRMLGWKKMCRIEESDRGINVRLRTDEFQLELVVFARYWIFKWLFPLRSFVTFITSVHIVGRWMRAASDKKFLSRLWFVRQSYQWLGWAGHFMVLLFICWMISLFVFLSLLFFLSFLFQFLSMI